MVPAMEGAVTPTLSSMKKNVKTKKANITKIIRRK